MFKLIRVAGESLSPSFNEGDFIVVSKVPFWFNSLNQGDVVTFNHPLYGRLLKQVDHFTEDGGVYVLGTRENSIDSRHFGSVRRESLDGKVIWHIKGTRKQHL